MYSDSGLPESLDGYSCLRLFIVLAMDSNNNVVGISTYNMN